MGKNIDFVHYHNTKYERNHSIQQVLEYLGS
jgi:hypothetical protein